MKWLLVTSLLVFALLVSHAHADDDDDGDGAYGADDGGDDGGYDAPADGDDDGYDAPADGDDDMGGDESKPQPEYVSTIERPNGGEKADSNESGADEFEPAASSRVPSVAVPPMAASGGHGSNAAGLRLAHAQLKPAAEAAVASIAEGGQPRHRVRRAAPADLILSRFRRSSSGGHGGSSSGGSGGGVVGPVHTYVRTDTNGDYRWGARHHVGSSYGRRRRR